MKEFRVKKIRAVLLSLVLCSMAFTSAVHAESDIDSYDARAIGNVLIETAGGSSVENGVTGYYAGDHEVVSVSVLPLSDGREPVIITVSDQAKILVDPNASDTGLTFTIAGNPAEYTDLTVDAEGSTMTFYAEGLQRRKAAKVSFEMVVPSNSESFEINARAGSTDAPVVEFPMFSTMDIHVPLKVKNNTLFKIYGRMRRTSTLKKGAAFIEILDRFGNRIIEKQTQCDENGAFSFEDLSLADNAPGVYKVIASAMDGMEFIGETTRTFELTNLEPITPIHYRILSNGGMDMQGSSPVNAYVITNSSYEPLQNYKLTTEVTLNHVIELQSARFLYDTGFGVYTYQANIKDNMCWADLTDYKINRKASLRLEITRMNGLIETYLIGYVNFYYGSE